MILRPMQLLLLQVVTVIFERVMNDKKGNQCKLYVRLIQRLTVKFKTEVKSEIEDGE